MLSSRASSVHRCRWPLAFRPLHRYLRNALPLTRGPRPASAAVCPGLLRPPAPMCRPRRKEMLGRCRPGAGPWSCSTCFPMRKPPPWQLQSSRERHDPPAHHQIDFLSFFFFLSQMVSRISFQGERSSGDPSINYSQVCLDTCRHTTRYKTRLIFSV